MAGGGIFDHLGGGFHRYAVDKNWLIPHFEKMLYDQAALILAYSEAQALAPRPLYAEVVAAVADYLEKELRAPDGAFYASQDADSEGREGAYYIWKKSEIIELLGAEAGEFCARAYGVSEAGNFADEPGASVLSRSAAKGDDAVEARLAAARQRLLAARSQRSRPRIDHKVITAWNGLAIAALARAAAVFAEPRYLALAETAAAALLPAADVRLRRLPQEPASPAFLDDYAFLIFGLLELEAVAPGKGYGSRAALFSEEAVKYFADSEGQRFFFTASDGEPLIARIPEVHDGALPGSNSMMILNLLRLAAAQPEADAAGMAEKALAAGAAAAGQAPLHYLQFLSALDEYLP